MSSRLRQKRPLIVPRQKKSPRWLRESIERLNSRDTRTGEFVPYRDVDRINLLEELSLSSARISKGGISKKKMINLIVGAAGADNARISFSISQE